MYPKVAVQAWTSLFSRFFSNSRSFLSAADNEGCPFKKPRHLLRRWEMEKEWNQSHRQHCSNSWSKKFRTRTDAENAERP